MDISNVASVASYVSAVSQAQVSDAVAITVLKKALDVQAQGAMQLIQAIPQVAPGTTATLGNNVNTTA